MSEHDDSPYGKRINIFSGTPWEPLRAFSRAVVVGDFLYISGTTSLTDRGDVVGLGKPYEQARFILERIKKVLHQNGFSIADVVRTRLFIMNMGNYDDFARAHRECFDTVRPASSIVQVARLADPRLLVEIEADAIRGAHPVSSRKLEE